MSSCPSHVLPPQRPLRSVLAVLACAVLMPLAPAQEVQNLPVAIRQALAQADIAPEAVSLLLADVNSDQPLLSHRADVARNPASVMKLVTTFAALDLLGPDFGWHTPVWLDGPVRQGVLEGNLVLKGQGDPSLTLERLWLLLRRVQGLGVRSIRGDIVLDESAFAPVANDPGDFDGAPLRPYNASPQALLINFKSIIMTFTPQPGARLARLQIDPPMSGLQAPASVALTGSASSPCGDWRRLLQADFSDPHHIRFAGAYPAGCGEKVWPLAYAEPAQYNADAILGLWQHMGGQLSGRVRAGLAPQTSPSLVFASPPLAEVVRSINKFSNNVMAQQLFLTLAYQRSGSAEPASFAAAQQLLQQWWRQRISPASKGQPGLPAPVMTNGSGLSRQSRISARGLLTLLQVAWRSPFMPELMSSLPLVGLDGTLRYSRAKPASAHLKTGSLQNVHAVAGFVHAANGRQLGLVVMIESRNAAGAKAVLDAVVDWSAAQAGQLPAQGGDSILFMPASDRP